MANTEIRLIIFFAAKDGEALYSQQKQDWELTGSDHELIIAKFKLKLKKVGKTTRPFRYDLNQIPYDYAVEVTMRFKGLDLIHRLPEELWMEVPDVVQETGIKTIPIEKKMQKSKMAVWGGLTNSCEKKRSEKQRRKGKIKASECRVPKNSKKR